MSHLFVTGTDTDIGKTVVTAALVSLLRNNGHDAIPMKPVQTGCAVAGSQLVAPDIDFCLKANGLTPSDTERSLMTPYAFRPACSPHLAADLDQVTISVDRIIDHFNQLTESHDSVLVEGAGGILVPLSEHTTMLDLMKALNLPVVLVARPGLGTINHTLLSLRELRRAGLTPAGIVFVDSIPEPTDQISSTIREDNLATIETFGGVPILGALPFSDEIARASHTPESFSSWCSAHLNLPVA